MPVVRRADDDSVDVVPSENLPVIPSGEDVVPVALLRGGQSPVEAVSRGHELHAGHAQRSRHVRHAHAAGPDHGQVDLIADGLVGARRDRIGVTPFGGGQEVGRCAAGERPRSKLAQKTAA